MPNFLTPLLREPDARYTLRNTRTQASVASTLLTAFDSKSRNRGLLGRNGLPSGTALLLAPTNAVHTCFMKFPIDIVFLSKDGTVTKVRAAVGPWRFAASWSAFATLELEAGACEGGRLVAGDRLLLDR
ncbi:MAG: DUF192 domain-containing protein [Acidobacteriaceae bacterium]|jgi:uncharacterized membrane protein (UPF0127 family)|nr:DUF192 domain-containing protein [Acidobacteriaceae bacterium]